MTSWACVLFWISCIFRGVSIISSLGWLMLGERDLGLSLCIPFPMIFLDVSCTLCSSLKVIANPDLELVSSLPLKESPTGIIGHSERGGWWSWVTRGNPLYSDDWADDLMSSFIHIRVNSVTRCSFGSAYPGFLFPTWHGRLGTIVHRTGHEHVRWRLRQWCIGSTGSRIRTWLNGTKKRVWSRTHSH